MAEVFAPQFFLLIGIDVFLGTSIIVVMLDEHFPSTLPYMLDVGALVGFGQLLIGPGYLAGFSTGLQFYYCVGYAAISVLSALVSNLYLYFMKGKRILSGVFAITASAPASLATVFFVSVYTNSIPIPLPLMPSFSWTWVYMAFFATAFIIVSAMVLAIYQRRRGGDIR